MAAYGPDDLIRDLDVSRETVERLATHLKLLETWSRRINLIGPNELSEYWRRHALDCAQLVRLAPGAKTWLDLGAGAGFPGLIVAGLLAGTAGAEVHLIEANSKKAAFLREAARAMGAPAKVFNQKIEDFIIAQPAGDKSYDVVTARALAPLMRLIDYAKPILDRGAQGLFPKGAEHDAELAAADLVLRGSALDGGAFRADVLESLSDPRGVVIRITKAA